MEQKIRNQNTNEKNITIDDLVLLRSELQARGVSFSYKYAEWRKYNLMRDKLLSAIELSGIGLTKYELCHIIECRQWNINKEVNIFCKSAIRHKREQCRLLGLEPDNAPFFKN